MLHENEDPNSVVGYSFFESFHDGSLAAIVNTVALDTGHSKNSLLRCQPASDGGIVRQEVGSADGNDESGNSLEDEEPSPAFEPSNPVHLENTNCNETSKCS